MRLTEAFAIAMLTCFVAGCSRPSSPATPDVAEDMAARARRAFPGATVTRVDARTLEVRMMGNESVTITLDNLIRVCAPGADANVCESTKERWIHAAQESFVALAAPAPLDVTSLRATLRPAEWVQSAAAGGAAIVSRPFVGDIAVVYVFDMPDSMSVMMQAQLAGLHMTADAAHERAVRNLDTALSAFPTAPIAPGSRVMSLVAGDSYEASRLLMTDRWITVAHTMHENLVASVPRRDQVLFADATDQGAITELTRHTNAIFATADHPISRTLLRFTPSGWQIFVP